MYKFFLLIYVCSISNECMESSVLNTLTPIQRGEGALSALRSRGGDAWRHGRDARRGPSDPAQEVDPGRSLVILQINPLVCF